MARDLHVSRITVEAAYAQLEAEGYVRRRVGDGTFVNVDVGLHAPAARPAGRARPERASWSTRGGRIVRGGGCVEPTAALPFSAGFPDLAEFPLDIWRRLTGRRLRGGGAHASLGYGDPAGEPALRTAIARYLAQSRGVRCSPEQVLVLTSSQQALNLVAMLLTDPDDVAWLEEPGYRGAQTALAAMGARLAPLPVDREGMILRPPRDSAAPRLIYVTPSHQYPTGVTLSLPRRLALIEYAHRYDAWIVEDDYDSEFQYDARPLPAMQGLDAHERVIYLGTFTTVLFPGLRLAYLVLPPALVSGFATARSAHDGHSARLSQLVTADFMEQGYFAAHVRRMRKLYQQRRDLLLDQIHRHIGDWCRPTGTGAGLQFTVTLPRGREDALTRAAAQLGVETPGLSGRFLSRPRLDGWMLGFAALREDEIVEGVRRLAKVRVAHRP
jgi:GntR family transcriptional regulator/MocR family aminotransferase